MTVDAVDGSTTNDPRAIVPKPPPKRVSKSRREKEGFTMLQVSDCSLRFKTASQTSRIFNRSADCSNSVCSMKQSPTDLRLNLLVESIRVIAANPGRHQSFGHAMTSTHHRHFFSGGLWTHHVRDGLIDHFDLAIVEPKSGAGEFCHLSNLDRCEPTPLTKQSHFGPHDDKFQDFPERPDQSGD
jgi:hypothetical protein